MRHRKGLLISSNTMILKEKEDNNMDSIPNEK